MTDTGLPLSNRSFSGIVDDHGERTVAVQDLCVLFGVDGLIRVPDRDFAFIDELPGTFVHFNLEFTLNEPGKRYAILPIVRAGLRKPDNEEVLPVLDIRRYRIGRCEAVLQRVALEGVSSEHLQYSIPTIRTIDELKKVLLLRYAPMFPSHTADELLSRGCAITRIQLLPGQELRANGSIPPAAAATG